MNEGIEKFSIKIKDEAYNLGFSICGFCKAEDFGFEKKYLKDWLNSGYQGNMKYLENNFDKRTNPSLLLENSKSIIVLGMNYFSKQKQPENAPKISKYAYRKDYHEFIKSKLYKLCEIINVSSPESVNKVCVDTVPILEKAAAQRAGLGWMGKNTCIINKSHGSYFFLGEIITSIELNYNNSTKNYCGNCTKCIDSCPTGAIIAPYKLDARKCISYQTIENKDLIPIELSKKFDRWAYGCDICQDVCKWNKKVKENTDIDFTILPEILSYNHDDWNSITELEFKEKFKNSAINRISYKIWKRNIENV